MKFLRKYHIYVIEFIIGNILFNCIYATAKTLTFKNIGAINEIFIANFITSFKETFTIYIIIYIILAILQILYDKSIVKKLNIKLNKTKERRES